MTYEIYEEIPHKGRCQGGCGKYPNTAWARGMSSIPDGWTVETATE